MHRCVQVLEMELYKSQRSERELLRTEPAVAEAFLRQRRAESRAATDMTHLAAAQNDLRRQAAKALADKDVVVAEVKKQKRLHQELESLQESKHAMKTFTPDALGQGHKIAGGAKGKQRRFEVLDRLARIKAGLSAGQKMIDSGSK